MMINYECYKIEIKNFLGIDYAELDMSSNVIIGGFNSTGKTTTMKVAYSFLQIIKGCELNNLKSLGKRLIKNNEYNFKDIKNEEYLNKLISVLIEEEFLKTFGYLLQNICDESTELNLYYKDDLYIKISGKETIDIAGYDKFSRLPSPRNIYFINGIHILNETQKILNTMAPATGDNGRVTLNNTSVFNYERILLNALFLAEVDDSFTSEAHLINNKDEMKKFIEDNLKEVSNYTRLTQDKHGNALITEDDGSIVPVALSGGGVKLLTILRVLQDKKLITQKNDYVFIDEPENGVHPNTQKDIMKALYALDCKLLCTTDSLYIPSAIKDKEAKCYIFSDLTKNTMKEVSIYDLYSHLSSSLGELY